MLQFVDKAVDISTVFWMFLVVFMIHDFEEIILVEGWFQKHQSRLQRDLPAKISSLLSKRFLNRTSQFATAVAWIFLLLSCIEFYTAQTGHVLLFVAALNVLFINVFTHLGQSLLFRIYTPGVVTALLVALPYSLYAYHRLFADGLVNWHDEMLYSVPLSIALVVMVGFGHVIAVNLLPKDGDPKSMG